MLLFSYAIIHMRIPLPRFPQLPCCASRLRLFLACLVLDNLDRDVGRDLVFTLLALRAIASSSDLHLCQKE